MMLTQCGICGGDGIPAVQTSQLATATVTATSSTPSENVAVLVRPTRTPTESATTSTHVLENSMPVACATDQEPSTSVDAQTSLKETATVTATSLTSAASVAVTASLLDDDGFAMTSIRTPMAWSLTRCGVCNGPGAM